ncbi:MAG: TetR/AcrR family transcriptional regulator [Actinomycetota bacterium]|jgi:AcrR family transcriptional regulator|nr:TetR/AcrR family transcriptional regulator [Actinomycetota bacterium]
MISSARGTEAERSARPGAAGRPRDPEIDRAVFDAALNLLDQVGYGQLSLEAIARRASVSRPSLYRRWPSKAAVVVAALAKVAGTDPAPDTGSLRGDLTALASTMAEMYNSGFARRVVPGLLGDLGDQPDLAERFQEAYIRPRRASTKAALARAVERGEIPPPADTEVVCDLLAGPPLLQAFVLDRHIDAASVAHIVDAVVTWLAHGPDPGAVGPARRRRRP